MKKIIFSFLLAIAYASPLYAQSQVTLKTYYPSPVGAYDRIRLVPRSGTGLTCDPSMLGLLFFDSDKNAFSFCGNSGSFGPLPGTWTQAGNDLYPTDYANSALALKIVPDLSWTLPPAKLTVWAISTSTTETNIGCYTGLSLENASPSSADNYARHDFLQVVGASHTGWNVASQSLAELHGATNNKFLLGAEHNALTMGSGNNQTAIGANDIVENKGSGTINDAWGILGEVNNASTGTISQAYAATGRIDNKLTGTIDLAFGLYSAISKTGAGPINTGFGVYIDTIKGTTNYGLYQKDATNKNYFAGNVGIGKDSPTKKLEVLDTRSDTVSPGDVIYASSSQILLNNTAATSAGFGGAKIGVSSIGSTNVNSSNYGILGLIWNENTATTDHFYGIESAVRNIKSGRINHAIAISGIVRSDPTSTGTIDNAYGLLAQIWRNAGTITNGYGVYIEDTQATNDWGIYQKDASDDNYFAGSVGIGTTTPSGKLHVAGGDIWIDDHYAIKWGGGSAKIEGENPNNKLHFYTNDTEQMTIDNTGNVGIGTTAPTAMLTVDNSSGASPMTLVLKNIRHADEDNVLRWIESTGEVVVKGSSKKHKKDIKPLEDDFYKALNIVPKSFTDTVTNVSTFGVLAEDVEELGLKNLVIYDEKGEIVSFKYDKFALYLLMIIKDQQQDIKNLKQLVCQDHAEAEFCVDKQKELPAKAK